MTTTETQVFRFPTLTGAPAELRQDHYETLMAHGGVSRRATTTVAEAAHLLQGLADGEARSIREIVRLIHDDETAEPTIAERRARVALSNAGLIRQIGEGKLTKYQYPGPRAR